MERFEEIICIMCPLACKIQVEVDISGGIQKITNLKCKKGKEYAIEETKNPVRLFTTTVWTENSSKVLLPVRTNKPIPKKLLIEGMHVSKNIRARPPIKIGEIIVPKILGTEADLIASTDLID